MYKVYLYWHTQHNKWKLVCFIFPIHLWCTCMFLLWLWPFPQNQNGRRSKWIPNSLFNLVLITKMSPEYRKDAEFWKSSEFCNVYFYAQMTRAVRFTCAMIKVNLNEKSIQIDPRILPILKTLHVEFRKFTLKLDQLVNSIKKVNWKTAVSTPYLTIKPKFDRKKSLYELFLYILILIKVYLDKLS